MLQKWARNSIGRTDSQDENPTMNLVANNEYTVKVSQSY